MKVNEKKIQIWLDEEGNTLTVTWGFQPGYYSDTDDDRIMVRLDMAGNVQGVQVDDLNSIRNKSIGVKHTLEWWDQLGKDNRGSRPRCALLVSDSKEEVARRLTQLVDVSNVEVSADDTWIPWGKPVQLPNGQWDKSPAYEAELDKSDSLLATKTRDQLREWWLAVGRNPRTPSWDIASTCSIDGEQGLLLVEAKAHAAELAPRSDRCGSSNDENRERIRQAISEAAAGLQIVTESPWNLSRDHHYQLSNRFAWAWKIASLGVPVVLMYLGFLGARDMARKELFLSQEDWEQCVKKYGAGVVDNGSWEQRLNIEGTPLLPIIRTYEQPFYP